MSNLTTGHEAEMDYEAEQSAAWSAKPKAERQSDVMLSRLVSAAESLASIGTTNLFGEFVTAEMAVESARHNIRAALAAADRQT